MKKTLSLILSLFLLILCLGVVACNNTNTTSHIHSAGNNEYAFDDNYHYQVCSICQQQINKEEHLFSPLKCKCGKKITYVNENIYDRSENFIYLGSYPQTRVTEQALIDALNSITDCEWQSYNYWLNGNKTDFMKYVDVTYENQKYRGVVFISYRPYWPTKEGIEDWTYQDDNGYLLGNVYWFKYEPIKWRILSEKNGQAFLFCENIIDSQEYDFDGASNSRYEPATIRGWLNNTFINTAFNNSEQNIILTTEVDNSERSSNPQNDPTFFRTGINDNASKNTFDKIFLLSLQELTNTEYGFDSEYNDFDLARVKKASDYSRCQGVYDYNSEHLDCAAFYTRSAHYYDYEYAWTAFGKLFQRFENGVRMNSFGIVPALNIKL